jgi:hypothetical protein
MIPVINAMGGRRGRMYGINFEEEKEKNPSVPKIQHMKNIFSELLAKAF